jgi:hypothetical protein
MALSINYFTSIQHLFIWGGIVFWFIFLMVYGAILDPYLSTTAYKVFIEAPCAPASSYWLITLLVLLFIIAPPLFYLLDHTNAVFPLLSSDDTLTGIRRTLITVIWYGKGHCGQQQ